MVCNRWPDLAWCAGKSVNTSLGTP
jgi:hypothetical protein